MWCTLPLRGTLLMRLIITDSVNTKFDHATRPKEKKTAQGGWSMPREHFYLYSNNWLWLHCFHCLWRAEWCWAEHVPYNTLSRLYTEWATWQGTGRFVKAQFTTQINTQYTFAHTQSGLENRVKFSFWNQYSVCCYIRCYFGLKLLN